MGINQAKVLKIKMNRVKKNQNQNQAKVYLKIPQALLLKPMTKLRTIRLYQQKKVQKMLPPKACIRPVDGLQRNIISSLKLSEFMVKIGSKYKSIY